MNFVAKLLESPAARWIGTVASAVCIGTFLALLFRAFSSDLARSLIADHWRALLGALALFGLAYSLRLIAWIVLAEGCGCRRASRELTYIFLISQVAKYLPGTVFQFVGRAYAGKIRGFELPALGKAMALEIGAVLASNSLLAGVAFVVAIRLPSQGAHGWLTAAALAITTCAALFGAATLFRRNTAGMSLLRPSVIAVACYAVLLMLVAIANVVLVCAISGQSGSSLVLAAAGAFFVSALAGFLAPGAPAGLGVRELAFCSMLAGVVSGDALILSAAAFRLVSSSGDLIAWLIGLAIRTPVPPVKPAGVTA